MAGTNFREGAVDAVRTAFCDFAADTVNFGHWFYDTTAPGFLPRREQLPQEPLLGGGLAGLICGNLPSTPLPPASTVPFSGGQCPGTAYSVEIDYIRNGVFTTSSNAILGPLGEARFDLEGSTYRGRWYRANGTDVAWTFASQNGGSPPSVVEQRIISVLSGPDDCGDPPAQEAPPPEPGSNDFDVDIEYDDGGGGTTTIPVDITFAFPQVDIDGTLVIPFNMGGVEFALNGDINASTGDINFNFGGGSPLSDLCCLADIFDDIVPDLPEDEPPENEEFFPRIVAVVVSSTTISDGIKSSTIGQNNGPNFYHPRLGNIHFNIGRKGKKVWLRDISVRNAREYVLCPVDYGAIEVVGDPIPGVSWQITPIYRRVIETEFPE